jgi:hypothetical protein
MSAAKVRGDGEHRLRTLFLLLQSPCPTQSFLLSNAVIGTYCRLYLVDTKYDNLNTSRVNNQLKLVLKGGPNKNRGSSWGDVGLNKRFCGCEPPPKPIVNHFRQIIWQLFHLVVVPLRCKHLHKSLACSNAIILTPATVLVSRNFARSRPFSLQQFLVEQSRPSIATMSDMEKKARLSGESPRASEPSSILPTVNITTEKPEPPKAALHPSVYIMYAS